MFWTFVKSMTDILTWERVGIPVEIDSPKKLYMITVIG